VTAFGVGQNIDITTQVAFISPFGDLVPENYEPE